MIGGWFFVMDAKMHAIWMCYYALTLAAMKKTTIGNLSAQTINMTITDLQLWSTVP
jgi:hypothetical protein